MTARPHATFILLLLTWFALGQAYASPLYTTINSDPDTSSVSILNHVQYLLKEEAPDSALSLFRQAADTTGREFKVTLAATLSSEPARVISLLKGTLPTGPSGDWYVAKGQLMLAEAYLREGKPREAKPLFTLAQKSGDKAGAPALTGLAYVGQGACCYYLQLYPEMERALAAARDLAAARLPANHRVAAIADHLLGVLYQANGDYDEALKVSLRVLQRAEENGEAYLLPYYINTGAIYLEKGEYAYAISYFRQGIEKGKGADESSLATCYNNIGLAYRRLGETRKAVHALKESIRLYEKRHLPANQRKMADAYNNLASCFLSENLPDSALLVMSKARTSIQEVWQSDALSWHTLGVAHKQKGDSEKAQAGFEHALRLHRSTYGANHPYQATIYTDLGRLANEQGDYLAALTWLDSALLICQPLASTEQPGVDRSREAPVATWHAFKEKALILSNMAATDASYLDEAIRAHISATNLLDDIRTTLATGESGVAWSQSAHSLLASGLKTAMSGYKHDQASDYIENALVFAEKNKSYKLLENTLEAFAALDDPYLDSLIKVEEQIHQNMASYKRKLAGSTDTSRVKLWQEKVFRLQQRYDSLVHVLKEATPAYYRQRYRTESLHADSLRSLLEGPEDYFIEFFTGEDETWAIWLSQQEAGIFSLGHTDSLRQQVGQYLSLISRPPALNREEARRQYTRFTTLSHALYTQLLGPLSIRKGPGPGRLIIVPDAWLSYLPFESLLTEAVAPDEEQDYSLLPYLVFSSSVTYAYSGSLLLSPYEPAAPENDLGLGIYAPFHQAASQISQNELSDCDKGKLYALSCSQKESEHIHGLAAGEVMYGQQASLAHFKQYAGHYSVLHLATHACLDPSDPELNRVYLADDYLTTSELYGMNLQAQLAVLSACNTGSGELVAGEGVMSLGRGLAYAGIPSMVTSLWPVDDCTTSGLMVGLYNNLFGEEGMTKDKALRQAKLAHIQGSESILSHPYYWAAFIHTGRYEALNTSATDYLSDEASVWWPAILLLLAGIGVLLYFFRRK